MQKKLELKRRAFWCALTVTAAFASTLSLNVYAKGSGSGAGLWASEPISFDTAPPGGADEQQELADLQARIGQLTEADHANVAYWQAGSVNHRWMQHMLAVFAKGPPSPLKSRGISLLSIAIYDAVVEANRLKEQFQRERPSGYDRVDPMPLGYSYPSAHAAAAAAAADVLSYLNPDMADKYAQAAMSAGQARVDAGANFPSDIVAGNAVGKAIASQLIAFSKSDNSDKPFTGNRPTGPGVLTVEKFVWPTTGDWKPWVIESAENYLPTPPPAHDSAEMAEELAKLKSIKRNVPAGIIAWTNHSTYRAYQWWYEQIAMSLFETRKFQDPLESSLIYATVSSANHDAIIACFKAKYTWWLIRPSQLDSSVDSMFPDPPHPSYPSAHSCSGASYSTALTHFFPEREQEFVAAAEQGGYSRQLAGIHYSIDHTSGKKIGISVAEDTLKHLVELRQ